jgi:aromatic-amino-acid transaminase
VIDGTVGMIVDEATGEAYKLPTVQRAMEEIGENLSEVSCAYQNSLGVPAFRESVMKLLSNGREIPFVTAATAGGSGALVLQRHLLKRLHPKTEVIIPIPGWAGYAAIFRQAGITVRETEYLERDKPDIGAVAKALTESKAMLKAVLLQAGCHNPTGKDFGFSEWQALGDICNEHRAIALVDMAYQGLGGEPEEDDTPIRQFYNRGVPVLGAWSAEKNHTLYSERTGLAFAAFPGASAGEQQTLEEHYADILRGSSLLPASIGQFIVARVQQEEQQAWRSDLRRIRSLLVEKRDQLKALLPSMVPSLTGKGMFASLPLNEEHLQRLEREHDVYLVPGGRLNIGGIRSQDIERLAKAITDVTQSSS